MGDTPSVAALIDVDGVLRVGDRPIRGAVEALAALRRRGVPFRLLTNTAVRSRASLGGSLRASGFEVADDDIITAGVATAQWLRRRYPGAPCWFLSAGDVVDDFDGVRLTEQDDARVVVIGGAIENGMEHWNYDAFNRAFRLLLDGAAFVATHRNPYWLTSSGPTLDSGAFVRGLEYASGRRATIVGKPAAPFFRSGFRALGLPSSQIVMIGDDLRADVLPAMRLGARGVLVRTGKFREADLGAGPRPDLTLDSIADLPGLFD